MSSAVKSLPDDVDSLKALVREQAERLQETSARNTYLQARILTLTEQLNLALARRYAASSEKIAPDQLRLFDEAESEADTVGAASDADGADEAGRIEVAAHSRTRRGRKPLPDTLARVEVIHDLAEEERVCPHDGRELKAIGEAVSEQLDIVPAKIQVLRLWRPRHKRKNWLFSDSVKGVTASANLYSLIETAKANGLEPYAYLREVFTKLPAANSVDDVEVLLPFNIAKDFASG